MSPTNRKPQSRRQPRALLFALALGTIFALNAQSFQSRATEIRFNTHDGEQELETRANSFSIPASKDERVALLDSELDHIGRKLADARLDASAQRASEAEYVATLPREYIAPSRSGSAERSSMFRPIQTENASSYSHASSVPSASQVAPYSSSAHGGLAVDDVREFSTTTAQIAETETDETYLEEIANEEGEEEQDATFVDVADECFYALDPYSSLFIEYQPTSQWTDEVLTRVQDVLDSLENPTLQTSELLKEFESKIDEVDALKRALSEADRAVDPRALNASDSTKTPRLVERYTLEQRLSMLDAFKRALQRRHYLWKAGLPYFQARQRGELVAPTEFTTSQLVIGLRETEETRAFFGDSPNGRNWRASFDVDHLADDLVAALELQTTALDELIPNASSIDLSAIAPDALEKERARRMRFLRDRLNSVAYKLEKTPMTAEQRQVFARPALAAWADFARRYSCDQANGTTLLYEFERYENSGGGQAGRALQQLALRMATSKSECARAFGRAIDVIYDNPNVKAYVSEVLINRMLPIRDPEFGVVRELILNNPVAGSRRVDTTVSIELTPDPERLLMNLVVNGRVETSTSSEVFSAKLHNKSYATYVGKKALEWRDSGLVYSQASVAANSINKLAAVETEIDFVPLVGGVAREVVRAQYEAKQGAIRAEMKARVMQEARERIDKEANERFDELDKRLRENFFARLNKLGLSLKTQRSKTTDDWLLASLRLGSDYSLGCQAPEPATLDGAFADVKLHESALNAYLAQLELSGRESDPRETLDYLAEKLNRPGLRDVELEDNDLSYTFADADPVVVRFFEDQIQLRLKFAKMRLGEQEWEDLETVVNYRPSIGSNGETSFARDGVVELYGPVNMRELLPLRAIFSKVFAAQKTFDIKAEALASDERFVGLALGLCRVAPGWFAISVVREPDANLYGQD